jgi:hypothetical protein
MLIIKFRNDIKQSKELKELVDGIEEQIRTLSITLSVRA